MGQLFGRPRTPPASSSTSRARRPGASVALTMCSAGPQGSSRSRPAARRWRFAAVAVVVFALGALQKATCLGEPSSDVLRKYCFTGLQFLWRLRGFSVDAVPYAGPPPGCPFDYVLEYPPGLAFGTWVLALVTHSRAGFFLLNALVSAGCLALAVWQTDMAHRPGPAGHPDGPDGRVPEPARARGSELGPVALAPAAAGLEIGRASCRERV